MFDVGFSEMLMVGLVGLLVLGPERLPKVAREAALWVRKARLLVNTTKAEIRHELDLEELNELRALKESIQLPQIDHLSVLQETTLQSQSSERKQPPAAPSDHTSS